MPPSPAFLPAGAPAYQLRLTPDGSWRLRVFHLPADGHAWVREVVASPVGEAAEFPKGVSGPGSVVVLAGSDPGTLAWLCSRLAKHGIPVVTGAGYGPVACT